MIFRDAESFCGRVIRDAYGSACDGGGGFAQLIFGLNNNLSDPLEPHVRISRRQIPVLRKVMPVRS